MSHPAEAHPIEVIAYHGWGFDQSCWDAWKAWFAQRQIPLTAFDRGYFGTAHTPVFANHRYKILIAHSYGLHLCPVEQLKQVNLLIIFSSFIEFHPDRDRDKRRSQRILSQMIQECEQHPQMVLNNFYRQCDFKDFSLEHPMSLNRLNAEQLVADLQNLNTSCLNIHNLKAIPNIIIFHGLMDQIVPAMKGQALFEQLKNFEQLKDKVDYFAIQEAGHALPFTHAKQCGDLLASKF